MAASDWVLDAPAPAPVTPPPASDWVLDDPTPAPAMSSTSPDPAATSDWEIDPPATEKQGFIGGTLAGFGAAGREAKQLATGQAFSDENIQPPVERTFMGNVGYGMAHGAPTIAGMVLGAMGGGAAGTAVGGPAGTAIGGALGGVAGGAATGFAQELIPAYQDARARGLNHDDAVSEAWTAAAASGALTGATAPLFGWAPFKSQVSNLLLHSLVTGPAVGAVQQGVVTPAVTGQPTPSAEDIAAGAAANVVGGGILGAGMHYAPRIAGRLVGRPGEVAPPAPVVPEAPVEPPGSVYGRELFTPPPEGVAPTAPVAPPVEPPPVVPPAEPLPVTPTTQVEPPPVAVAPPAVPTPIPAEPPVKEPPSDVTRPIAPQPTPEPGAVGAVPVAPVEPAAGAIRPEPAPGAEPIPGPGPVEPVPGPEPGTVAPAPRTEPEQPPTPAPAVQPAGVPAPEPSPAYRTEHPDIPETLYRGSGREDQASVYNPAGDTAIPILGPGRYAAFSEEHAKQFGPNIETTPLDLKNPLVIRTDDQWRTLTREAGWKSPNLFGLDKTEVGKNTQDMRDLVQAKGHDGVIVHWDDSTPYDIDKQGRSIKTLRNVFGDPQVVDYRAPREPLAPGGPADILARLDAEKAPDSAYRDALSTGSKEPLKAGETWRDRLVKWAESEKQPLEPAPTPTPSPEPPPVAVETTGGTAEDLSKRGPGPFRGAARKTAAPGAEKPLPPRVRTAPRLAPKAPPEVGRPLTLEDYNYSRDVTLHRQAFHEALAGTGEDPVTAANKPMPEQVTLLQKALRDKYGFSDVKVEPGVEPRVTRDQMLNMHQNMQNMAHALGWAPEVMSLDGRVNLQLVPRNFDGGHWMGMYSLGPKTIGISGGSNSFAHELWHGIDHYLSDTLNRNPNKQALLTWNGRAGTLDPHADPVQAAFAQVLNTMSHGSGAILQRRLVLERTAQQLNRAGQPTRAAIAAREQLDRLNSGATGGMRIPVSNFVGQALAMRNPRYFASVHELFARMAEAYTGHKMALQGMDTAGVVKSDKAYTDQTIKYLRDAYPDPFDRVRIFAAMDNLNLEMQRAAVLNRGHAPAQRASTANTLTYAHERPADVGPGFMARLRGDLGALRPARLLAPEHDALLNPEGRPPPPLTYATKGGVARPKSGMERAADNVSQIFNSAMGNMERMIAQMPPGARPYARQIMDKLGVSHGVKQAQPVTFDERVRNYSRKDIVQTEDAFRDAGLVNRVGRLSTTPEQDSMIWHTLTTGQKNYPLDPANPAAGSKPIPANLLKFAERVRPLLDAAHERMRAAGIDVGHASEGGGYAPRIWDDFKILSDRSGFVKDMTELNRRIIDKDVDGAADSPARLSKWWRESDQTVREDPRLDPDARNAMVQMGRNLRRIARIDEELAAGGTINPTTHSPTALRAERDALVRTNQDLFDEHRATIRDHIAAREADNRLNTISMGHPSNFETFGPKSSFLKGRTMPPETDQIMRKYLVQNPRVGLPNYFQGVARKTAYHELFGKNGDAVEILLQHMEDNGAHRDMKDNFRKIVELVTGRSLRDQDAASANITGLISAMGALRSLPGASISALGEPFATLLNRGSPRMMYKTFTNLFGQFVGSASGAERMATLRAMGGVSSRLQGAASAGRFSDYAGTPRIANLMNGFFELALSPAIRNIRAATLGAGTEHIKLLTHLATDPATTRGQLNRQDDARGMLREWGVPDARIPELRQWLDQFQDMPSRARIAQDPTGELYELAANRMLDRFNQDPTAAEKPLGSLKSPWLNMMTQLTAFPYAFWRHVMEPMLHRAAYNRQRQYDRTLAAGGTHNEARFQAEVARFGAWANATTGAMALLAGTGLMYAARTYLLSHQTWRDHEEKGDLPDWLLGATISQSGLAGPLDIVNQAAAGIRYHADVAALTQGPYLSSDVRYVIDVIKGLEGVFGSAPTPGTNTENYNALYALTQLVAKPGALTGLVWLAERVPEGGPLAALITASSILGTSATATRGLVDTLAGERGTKLPKAGEEDMADTGLTNTDLPMTDLEQQAESDGKPGAGGGGVTNLAVGLLDDVLMPLMKIAPTSLKVGIGGLAAAGGLGGLLKQGQMYRSQGVPP